MAEFSREALMSMSEEDLRDVVSGSLRYFAKSRLNPAIEEGMPQTDEAMVPPVTEPGPMVGEAQQPMGMEAQDVDADLDSDPFSPDSRLDAARKAVAEQREARRRRREAEEIV